ncbi:hypothetical protein MALG_01651 [Marinovum algicola DG 898]|nr:hypothetical protein MALG_01651 [Marinovum algicola DG 898]
MRLFDGMSDILAGVHGAPVTHIDGGAVEAEIRAIFREEPEEAPDDRGNDVLTLRPYLAVPRDVAAGFVTGPVAGDQVVLADARRFRLLAAQYGGSPAADGLVYFDLEELD